MADPLEHLQLVLHQAKGLAAEAAPDVAKAVEAALRAELAAGKDPYGVAWEPTKDGKRALPDAANAVTVTAVGATIIIKAPHPYGFHQSPGGAFPQRKVVPDGALPAKLAGATAKALEAHMAKVLK